MKFRTTDNNQTRTVSPAVNRALATILLTAGTLIYGAQASAAVLRAGTCGSNAFPTIQEAVASAAAGDTVAVCPGTYQEMVVINKNLTLSGISAGRSNPQPTLQYPASTDRLCTLSSDPTLCAQILVQDATVTITGLKLDGSNFRFGCPHAPAGIVFYDAAGTVSNDTIVNHAVTCGDQGFGVLTVYDTTAKYKINVSSSSISSSGEAGVLLDGNNGTELSAAQLTGSVSSNTINANVADSYAIGLKVTSGVNVSGNKITTTAPNAALGTVGGLGIGIQQSTAASITGNTIVTAAAGVLTDTISSSSVTGNTISGVVEGLDVRCTNTTAFDGNRISDAPPSANAVGMHLRDCNSTPPVGTNHNTIDGNRFSGFCAGILTGSALNSNNSIAGNTFLLIGPGADIMGGDVCP